MDYRYNHYTPRVLADEIRAIRASDRHLGDPLPEFDLPTADGGVVHSRDLRGRPLLLALTSFT